MFWGKKEKQTNVSIKVLLCPPCSLNVINIRIQFRHNICILFYCSNLLDLYKKKMRMNDVIGNGSTTKKRNKKRPETYLPQDRLSVIVDDARKPVFGFISSSNYWFSLIDKLSSYCWAISVWQTNNNQISIIGQRALITRRPILIHPAKPRPPAKSKQT